MRSTINVNTLLNIYFNINLQKLDLVRTPDNFLCEFVEDVPAVLPKVLLPNETLNLNLDYYAERNQGGKLKIELLINDPNPVPPCIPRGLQLNLFPFQENFAIRGDKHSGEYIHQG